MSKLRVAYGKRDDIEIAIERSKIPPGTLILTEDSSEMYFYNLERNLCAYQKKNRFQSREEAESWIAKYDCKGEILTIQEEDNCNIYIVGYDNQLKRYQGSSESDGKYDISNCIVDIKVVGSRLVAERMNGEFIRLPLSSVGGNEDLGDEEDNLGSGDENKPGEVPTPGDDKPEDGNGTDNGDNVEDNITITSVSLDSNELEVSYEGTPILEFPSFEVDYDTGNLFLRNNGNNSLSFEVNNKNLEVMY